MQDSGDGVAAKCVQMGGRLGAVDGACGSLRVRCGHANLGGRGRLLLGAGGGLKHEPLVQPLPGSGFLSAAVDAPLVDAGAVAKWKANSSRGGGHDHALHVAEDAVDSTH